MIDFNIPICGYCGLEQSRHEPNDHLFDAVGGSPTGPKSLSELRVDLMVPRKDPIFSTLLILALSFVVVILIVVEIINK